MTKITKITFAFLFLYGTILATIWQTPEQFPPRDGCIQRAIDDTYVVDGDTISVLQGTVQNPEIYYENITFSGKNITVINRDFLPGNNNDPSTCIINGQQQGSVVTFWSDESRNAVLKGFTITNGSGSNYDDNFYGGGVLCGNSSPTLANNRITKNYITNSFGRGGGIAIVGEFSQPRICHNSIDSNYAFQMGGGIAFDNFANPDIDSNNVYGNGYMDGEITWKGGGISATNEEVPILQRGSVVANVIKRNISFHEFAANFYNATPIIRANEIKENGFEQPSGNVILCEASYGSNALPDFGRRDNPGYNVFKDNGGECDLSNGIHPPIPLEALGNYWNTLNTSDIINRTNPPGSSPVDFNPVAASDKWFSIETDQSCETNVLVTGILTVTLPEGFLTIAPGDTFWFLQKDNMPGLKISGGLIAESGIDNMITFLPYPFWPPPTSSVWSGIDIESTAWAHFIYCKIVGAYNGICLEDVTICGVHNCEIVDNQFAGIHVKNSSLTINGCSIMRNGVSGIEVWVNPEQSRHPLIRENNFCDNGRYGIKWENGLGASIKENIITNEITPSVDFTPSWGIYLLNVEENGEIRANEITNFVQSGICENGSYVPIDSNFCIQNHELLKEYGYGIWCSNSSSPLVRKNTINYWKSGVHCDNNSYPNLGIYPDSGKNSILMENYYWVTNFNPEPQQYIRAELNWWGTSAPYEHPEKFIGLVDYDPWLTEPLEEGGQSADITKLTLTFNLFSPKPNPAKGKVRIVYSLPNQCKSELIICDASGRIITKTTEDKEPGQYEYLWHGKDQKGKAVPSGIYFVRLRAGNNIQTQKITLTK